MAGDTNRAEEGLRLLFIKTERVDKILARLCLLLHESVELGSPRELLLNKLEFLICHKFIDPGDLPIQ